MTNEQWNALKQAVSGTYSGPPLAGFIIDSPWLPAWHGISIMDYFSDNDLWFEANLKAVETFPDAIFLPGFWSEFGMCTEPSAFGAPCSFPENEFPHAHPVIRTIADIEALPQPDPAKDGLLPFVTKRLLRSQARMNAHGHHLRFAVTRGPLNICSYLMGTTEFLLLMMTEPQAAHALMQKVTDFLERWIARQRNLFPDIDGLFVLDDIIGFMGREEFESFGFQYFKRLFAIDVAVKFLHNDAPCEASAPLLADLGVNLFNMGFDTDLSALSALTGNQVCMLGNIPPRDILAAGSPDDVRRAVSGLRARSSAIPRIILSCGGGMPPGVSTENISAFIEEAKRV